MALTESERDSTPMHEQHEHLRRVPVAHYQTLSEEQIVDGGIYCTGCSAEPFEITRERLWLSLPVRDREQLDHMSPYEVLMNAPSAPRLQAVPSNVYMKMSASEVMAGNVVCDGLDWVTFEVSRERLRRSLPQDEQADIDNMTPYEVAMMAPSQPCAS